MNHAQKCAEYQWPAHFVYDLKRKLMVKAIPDRIMKQKRQPQNLTPLDSRVELITSHNTRVEWMWQSNGNSNEKISSHTRVAL